MRRYIRHGRRRTTQIEPPWARSRYQTPSARNRQSHSELRDWNARSESRKESHCFDGWAVGSCTWWAWEDGNFATPDIPTLAQTLRSARICWAVDVAVEPVFQR